MMKMRVSVFGLIVGGRQLPLRTRGRSLCPGAQRTRRHPAGCGLNPETRTLRGGDSVTFRLGCRFETSKASDLYS
ncbi:hypothetical protein EYF80_046591 [Liparis tanakae]|uniref:Uncharacterized protein n=1 Tax=Liparis tanakae TaxID=230148 RepID=A0A4Z2FQZ7_9TELE|nr:hypothetical protein EYF80_046591 [Liparis tanakae]